MAIDPDLVDSEFADHELTTTQKWYDRVFTFINQMSAVATPLSEIWQAHSSAVGSSVSTGTWTDVAVDTIEVDTSGGSLSSGGFLCADAGTYMCGGNVKFTTSGAGHRRGARIALNGTGQPDNVSGPTTGDIGAVAAAGVTLTLAPGDLVTLQGYQDSGGGLTTQALCILTIVRLS